jgi:Tfp pilus assembly major pilin PilA
LGDLAERNYFLSQSLWPGGEWVTRPLVIVLGIISILGLAGPLVSDFLKKRTMRALSVKEADVVSS